MILDIKEKKPLNEGMLLRKISEYAESNKRDPILLMSVDTLIELAPNTFKNNIVDNDIVLIEDKSYENKGMVL